MSEEQNSTTTGNVLQFKLIRQAVADNHPRRIQANNQKLGPSELKCREYIRASAAGVEREETKNLEWAAQLGTIIGDWAEDLLQEQYGGTRQAEIVTRIGDFTIAGHADLLITSMDVLVDVKTKNGLNEVRNSGPSFGELAQISTYHVGAVQAGALTENSTSILLYLDRSGKHPDEYEYHVSYQTALETVKHVEERLNDVARALAYGGGPSNDYSYLRDIPEQLCSAMGCPFYNNCWTQPNTPIEDPDLVDAVHRYAEISEQKKQIESEIVSLKEILTGVYGVTNKYQITWRKRTTNNGNSYSIDIRKRKERG